MEQPRSLADHIDAASTVLKIATMLSVKRGLFKRLHPTEGQLGWSYGFCDAFAQRVGLQSDKDFILFISMAFERVFGSKGITHFRNIALDQSHYRADIILGGTAHNKWLLDGTPPLMPMAD